MIRQKDYQWEAAIKIAKADGADYVAILLGRLRDAQKEIEALEAAEQNVQLDGEYCTCKFASFVEIVSGEICRFCNRPRR